MSNTKRNKRRKDSYSPTSEQFKLIRTGIDFSGIDEKKQVILITSPESGTGKSTVSSHLAVAYAEKGARTLLIDADMRKPTLHKRFSKNLHLGLSNVMTGDISLEDSIQEVELRASTLSILTSGPIPPNPNDLLSSKKMSELIEALRDSFDKIIIDTPPVTIVSDALVLADSADGTVLVCRYHKTLKEKAKHAVNQLRLSKAKLIGVIFNGTKNAENYYY
ncbi:CpsD/CapB family tyrosine-protein kinase [Listeria fleischmannii]|uniref:non-specific protein-tyrosine kinase n=1 Tax=Listeria fleischmannii TaxID=1069827 RepID=A0A841YDW3_9LIST|nr:CpsD/CapB family tyrosine-protein kinase [Listeria fleischmannii]EIA20024.1 capsular exopolysaccharide family protein [Listeria fleischmannii subsp. coloradonensis]MBC1398433.1 CpsD/CapB family tyrosine-protein kinase [Listeria fleischmannii]MBC1418732.1 CpsD/CapB family tyrosine-protein kinase [Listeria fleischmannii]MBC1426494.1 CpsD/CapB family tyrosine-protein kinase [Listeria fleischmannii]STY46592.1 Tyrosine-protein kinase YwqD [Listeria fleischmannii subsp. coloradonensis]